MATTDRESERLQASNLSEASRRHLSDRIMELTAGDKRIQLDLEAPRAIVPPGGNRTLAVMFGRLTLRPLKPG